MRREVTLPAVDRSAEFLRRITAAPGIGNVRQCIQCGTCSASCPSSHVMDLSPRRVIAALGAGMLDRVLRSNALWLCASCYACSVRCPSGIPFTDVMYELKREAATAGVADGRDGAALARAFIRTVDRNGRSGEAELLRRYYLATHPLRAVSQLPLAWRLWRRGRLALRGAHIRGLDGLRRMMAAITGGGSEA